MSAQFDYNSHKQYPGRKWIVIQLFLGTVDFLWNAALFPLKLLLLNKEKNRGSLTGQDLGAKYDAFHHN